MKLVSHKPILIVVVARSWTFDTTNYRKFRSSEEKKETKKRKQKKKFSSTHFVLIWNEEKTKSEKNSCAPFRRKFRGKKKKTPINSIAGCCETIVNSSFQGVCRCDRWEEGDKAFN